MNGGPVPMMGMRPGLPMGFGMNGMGMSGAMNPMGRGFTMGPQGMPRGGGLGGPMGSLAMPSYNMGMGQHMGQFMGQMGPNMVMPQNGMPAPNGMGGMGGNGMYPGGMGNGHGLEGRLGGGMEQGWRDPGLLLPSRRKSPEYNDRGRSRRRRTRSRSRSYSRHRRSSRRSRSKTRSCSRGRSRAGPSTGDSNVLDMTYEDYLERFERMRQQKATSAVQVGQQQQQPLSQESYDGSMAQNGSKNSITGGRPVLMSEQAYIHHCRQLAVQNCTPFDLQAVQQFYRQMAAQMTM